MTKVRRVGMDAETVVLEGIVEILEEHFFTGMEPACSCGTRVQNTDEHRYHVAQRIAGNVDYWFGLKRFVR